jgi:hypothetical protein
VFKEGSEEKLAKDEEARAQKKKDSAGSDSRDGETNDDKSRK